jgi:endoribonuclease LACTB2
MQSPAGRLTGYDVSAWVLGDVLVDSGFPLCAGNLLRAVGQIRPRGAVITHWHEDHSGGAVALVQSGMPIHMHPATERILRERPPIGLYRKVVWGRPAALRGALTSFDVAPFQVLETPGHTPDHLVVWDEERGVVASGDLFLGVHVRIAHRHEQPRRLIASLRMVAALEPRLLLDAHRGVIGDPAPLLRAKVAWMEDTLGEIERLSAQGVSERAIRQRVLGHEEFTGYVSLGEYSRQAFVHAALHSEEARR